MIFDIYNSHLTYIYQNMQLKLIWESKGFIWGSPNNHDGLILITGYPHKKMSSDLFNLILRPINLYPKKRLLFLLGQL